ncbi:DUF4430 domain-containing protein [Fundicoccus sp. Sow4_H7]|uniref:DUF4430 domain-containing protein n=1 Tax=Fundicoccus sp. Sow4_H7 TaxID=3438784 RepID=UPI003F921018
MKKSFLLFSSVFILAACANTTQEAESVEEVATSVESTQASSEADADADALAVTINLSVPGEDFESSKEITIEEGAMLLDIMKENFDVVDEDGFITSIEGYEQDPDAGLYWLFDVNGEMAEVGAAELELKADDIVDWSLAPFE